MKENVISTVGEVQYHGGNYDTCVGDFQYPQIYRDILHGTEQTLYGGIS